MPLYDQIKEALKVARVTRSQQPLTLYSTLIGEIERDPKKNFSNDSVVRVIKKFIEGLNEIVKVKAGTDSALYAQQEINLLSQYLPKMAPVEEMTRIVKLMKESNPECKISDVMSYFDEYKKSTGLDVDKSVVSRLFRQV